MVEARDWWSWFMCFFKYRVGGRRKKHWDREGLWTLHGGRCYLCGDAVGLGAFEIEHIVPLARGGSDLRSNLSIAHKACNLRKGTKLLSELDWLVS